VPYQGRALASEYGVTTACEPRGTDSDGSKLIAARWDTDGQCVTGTDVLGTDSLGKAGDPNARLLLGPFARKLGWTAHAVTTEATECHQRSLIQDAARSRALQAAARMRLTSRSPTRIVRDTDSDAGSDNNRVGCRDPDACD
jgi:hypothetical protein